MATLRSRRSASMKYFAVVVVVVAVVAGLVAAKQAGVGLFNPGLKVTLSSPSGLSQSTAANHSKMGAGEWTKVSSVRLWVRSPRMGRHLRLQVQLAKNGAQPTGKPSPSQSVDANTVIVSRLADGSYRWWARYVRGSEVSPWVAFSSGLSFGIDKGKPPRLKISSSTDPSQSKVYRSGRATFQFTGSHPASGVSGYWYDLATPSSPLTAVHVITTQPAASFSGLATGTYILHARVRDRAGSWSPDSTYRIRLDSTPPTVTNAGFSTFDFNPSYGSMTLNYVVNRPSRIRVGIYRHIDNRLVRLAKMRSTKPNELLHYTWHGRNNHGQRVGPGAYDFYVRTTDKYGNSSVKQYSGLAVMDKRIVVSLTKQRLWAYSGSHLLLTSLVTTGNKALPTPPGIFTILSKYHPFTFRSPFPKSSPYWYPPSPVKYAMLFRAGGYYIHDAPWRSNFGPGSNAQTGTPGQNYTGTHGCVNVPPNVAYRLFYWAPDGTPVIVKR